MVATTDACEGFEMRATYFCEMTRETLSMPVVGFCWIQVSGYD